MLCWKRVIRSTVWCRPSSSSLISAWEGKCTHLLKSLRNSARFGKFWAQSNYAPQFSYLTLFLWQVATAKWMEEFGAVIIKFKPSPHWFDATLVSKATFLLFDSLKPQHRVLWYLTESFPSRHTRKKHRFVLLPGQESCLMPGWGLLLTFH